ncbi:MAG: hypothetical protein MI717_10075, partial [Spirochaetales bacterium]|nr:hypothetical protein [Spirochaetales bacterium]
LDSTREVKTILELGANVGLNLLAINSLLDNPAISAIEINKTAVKDLEKISNVEIFQQSILDFSPERTWDFVFSKTVLIHINPDMLPIVYDLMYKASNKYICVCEYYNPAPVTVVYRGETEKLFKRDFAGDLLKKYPDLELIDYGFVYHNDKNFPQDDINWFLLEKKS